MVRVNPVLHCLSDSLSQRKHFVCFLIRHRSGPFVFSDVPFLSEDVKPNNAQLAFSTVVPIMGLIIR